MNNAFGRADGEVLTGVERAAHNGRRITARRARRDKRSRHVRRGWSIGSLTVTPVIALVAGVVLLACAAGAAVALGGTHAPSKQASSVAATTRPVASTTRPTAITPGVAGVYIKYTDAAAAAHYMYCTKTAGCGLLEVAKDGTSTIAAELVGGVWHRVQRRVIQHDPCIDIVQNAVRIGKPGDFVAITTTNLHPAGRQSIKGISVPARIAGDVAVHFEYPEVPGCDFSGTPDFSRPVDSPVTEYVPAGPEPQAAAS